MMKPRFLFGGALLLAMLGSWPLSAQESRPELLYSWDFESATPFEHLSEMPADISVTDDPLTTGNHVMRVLLPNGSSRSEVSVGDPKPHYFYCDSTDMAHGDELWVGFRIMIPRQTYTGDNNNITLFQIGPIQNIVSYPGVSSKGHFQFQFNTSRNRWRLREFASIYNPGRETAKYLVSANTDAWETIVIHLRFRSDDQGVIELWRNGDKIFEQQRPNGTPHARTRVKWGAYVGKENGSHEPFVCYFDDVRIGGKGASYEDVCPASKQ